MLAKTTLTPENIWSMPVPESTPDRRRQARVELTLPVVIFRSGEANKVETQTRNVSCDSFYCVSETPFSPGEHLECEITLPGDDRGSVPEPDLCLECRVEVVRVVANGVQKGFGVAFRVEDFTIRRSAGV